MQHTTSDDKNPGPPGAGFSAAGVRRGAWDCGLVSIAVLPFGLAFGLAAADKGLAFELTMAMSVLVFAGLSQMTALELWTSPLPVLPILLVTFTLNTRHILYGAAMAPWARKVKPLPKYLTATIMADINWAMTMQAKERGEMDFGYLLGGGLLLWTAWQVSTAAGYFLGGGIGDPKALGLDAVVVALFATTLVGLWRGREDIVPWIAAAAASLFAYAHLPLGWHIIVGALVGGLVGVRRFAR
jgi:4-azaleucine resistance transporter AzlC